MIRFALALCLFSAPVMPLALAFAIATGIETATVAWFFSDPDNVLLASILLISLMAVGV